MKYFTRQNLYKASNVTFSPETMDAYSYGWWRFVAKVDGLLIFNNARYSNSTSKHQSKVRRLLETLGIKIDLVLTLPRGIRTDQTLAEMIVECEEHLCNVFLREEAKRDARNEKLRLRRLELKLEDYLENSVNFRDYEIKPASDFGTYAKAGVHQVVNTESLERDVTNALDTFHRDGFSNIVFYVQAKAVSRE